MFPHKSFLYKKNRRRRRFYVFFSDIFVIKILTAIMDICLFLSYLILILVVAKANLKFNYSYINMIQHSAYLRK